MVDRHTLRTNTKFLSVTLNIAGQVIDSSHNAYVMGGGGGGGGGREGVQNVLTSSFKKQNKNARMKPCK